MELWLIGLLILFLLVVGLAVASRPFSTRSTIEGRYHQRHDRS